MVSKINVKILSENSLNFFKKNLDLITTKIKENNNNKWIYEVFPQPMFIEKKLQINDFGLKQNSNSADKQIDLINSITLYENLKDLPRHLLTNECFWLWLHLEKYYEIVRSMMPIRSVSTITDHWLHKQGTRRGLMFGVLSRCYFRVALTIDSTNKNPYLYTEWIIQNPERYRNLTWRSFSSEEHLVRGILKGEKRAIDENPMKEKNDLYPLIAKHVSLIGGIRLLDVISEEDIENMIYIKMLELIK